MAYNQSKNPFSKNPLNFNSPLNSFDSLVGKLMNQGKSKEAATKIAGKVANAKMKGAGSGPTAAQKARAKDSAAKMADESPLDKELIGNQHRLPEELKEKIEAAPESPAKHISKFMDKDHPHNREPKHSETLHSHKDFKKKKESPAKMKSPVKAHDKALKALEKRIKRVRQSKEGSEGQGGIDYELLAQLEEQKKKLIESHGKEAKQNAKPSPAAMKSPAKKASKKAGKSSAVSMKSPMKKDGKGDAHPFLKPAKAATKAIRKAAPKVKKVVEKVAKGIKEFAKDTQKRAT
jgi:hypothetical protein